MAEVTVEHLLIEAIRRLTPEQQQEVLVVVRRQLHETPIGETGATFLQRTRNVYIDAADLDAMQQAIEDDCESKG